MTHNHPAGRSSLGLRDAFADRRHVVSDLRFKGSEGDPPKVTVAIPTFKRPDLLAEAVCSALAQDFDGATEIVVVDNDPSSNGADRLVAALPKVAHRDVRYFVNRENIGPFPNWNRCIELARGEWVTILNDDDLLDPCCLSLVFDEVRRDPAIDGIAVGKRWLDERTAAQPPPASPLRRLAVRLMKEALFRRQRSRPIGPERFFWGALLGNSGGFVFRRAAALDVGGFYPEDHPSSDYWFYARFAARHHLRQHRASAVQIRKTGDQITGASVLQQLAQGHRLQMALTGTYVPSWRRHLVPLLAARHLSEFHESWGATATRADLERELNVTLPPDRRWLVRLARVTMRGF